MIEPLLCGIVLGLIPVTLVGLFVAAWNQYRRGSALGKVRALLQRAEIRDEEVALLRGMVRQLRWASRRDCP